jgi:hypothetical protein
MQDRPVELQKGCLKMDLTKFALVVMKNVRDFVQPALDSIDERIDEVKHAIEELRLEKPLDRAALDSIIADAVAKIPAPVNEDFVKSHLDLAIVDCLMHNPPAPGKDADPEQIAQAVKAAVDALPKPQDGRSVTLEEVAPLVSEAVAKAIASLPAPKDGTSVALGDVVPELSKQVAVLVGKWLDATPIPKDGKSITVEDVEPLLDSMHSRWALDFERRAQDLFQRAIDRMPAPQNGTDGKDGLGFDDMTFEQIDERSGVLRFTRGTTIKEFPIALAGFVDRGLWQEGEFTKGDGVTWEGNYWLARRDTKAKPGAEGEDTGNNDWRLAVRKGRKGKDGDRGRDLRSVTAKLSP